MEEKTYFVYKYTRGPWGPFNSAEILDPLRLLSVSSTYSKCSISLKHSSALNTHSNDFIRRYTERVMSYSVRLVLSSWGEWGIHCMLTLMMV